MLGDQTSGVQAGDRQVHRPARLVPQLGPFRADNGWVLGPNKERLIWIPWEHRERIRLDPRNIKVMGGPTVTIDLQGSLHGAEWSKCYVGGDNE